MKKIFKYSLLSLLLAGAIFALAVFKADSPYINTERLDRQPVIHPDYSDLIIPFNIAPLNFVVREEGSEYHVNITADSGPPIDITSSSPKIVIPAAKWHKLLDKNRGQELVIKVSVRTEQGQQFAFSPLKSQISMEKIDPYVVYRRIHPVHNNSSWMGIYQQNIKTSEETLVLDNSYFKQGCLNCHTFLNNRADMMLLDIRSPKYSSNTLFAAPDGVRRIGTKFTFMGWHPTGRVVVYSLNAVGQFFHTVGSEMRDTLDYDSTLAYYSFDTDTVKVCDKLSRKDRLETFPTWSPDGGYLYFCTAPKRWTSDATQLVQNYREGLYDLVRISYDLETDEWGQVETVLSAAATGKSALLPRISPDGRWLLFCLCDRGCLATFQPSSDLYLIDLNKAESTGSFTYTKLAINSDRSEAWHSWSSNGRWIIFSSRRDYADFTRSYISYIDTSGNASKPFILPRKDPEFYDSCIYAYSLPEFVDGPLPATREKLARVIRRSQQASLKMPITMATPTTGDSQSPKFWKERE